MPLTKDITFKCPNCGEEIPLTLWQSVNTAENPREAEALAYGDLFYIECPKCGYQTMANYSLLYHDAERGVMIQYIATQDREERAKEMAEYRKASRTRRSRSSSTARSSASSRVSTTCGKKR